MIGRDDIGRGHSHVEGSGAISAALCADCCVRPDLAAFTSAAFHIEYAVRNVSNTLGGFSKPIVSVERRIDTP
jgi:hypothetical protein